LLKTIIISVLFFSCLGAYAITDAGFFPQNTEITIRKLFWESKITPFSDVYEVYVVYPDGRKEIQRVTSTRTVLGLLRQKLNKN